VQYRNLRFVELLGEEARGQYPPMHAGVIEVTPSDKQISAADVAEKYDGTFSEKVPDKPTYARTKFGFANVLSLFWTEKEQ